MVLRPESFNWTLRQCSGGAVRAALMGLNITAPCVQPGLASLAGARLVATHRQRATQKAQES